MAGHLTSSLPGRLVGGWLVCQPQHVPCQLTPGFLALLQVWVAQQGPNAMLLYFVLHTPKWCLMLRWELVLGEARIWQMTTFWWQNWGTVHAIGSFIITLLLFPEPKFSNTTSFMDWAWQTGSGPWITCTDQPGSSPCPCCENHLSTNVLSITWWQGPDTGSTVLHPESCLQDSHLGFCLLFGLLIAYQW